MTWTYNNDPGNSDRDALRLTIGDISEDEPQLTDEELAYMLTAEGSVLGAAVAAVRVLQAVNAKAVDKAVGDLKISYSQRAAQYASLLKQLEARSAIRLGRPFAGGLSIAQKDAQKANTDRVDPRFERGQFRFPYGLDTDDDTTR